MSAPAVLGARPRSILEVAAQSALALPTRNPGAMLRRLTRDGRETIRMGRGRRRVFLLTEPDDVRTLLVTHAGDVHKGPGVQATSALLGQGLLTSEGAAHARARRLVGAAFSPTQLDAYTAVMVEEVQASIERLAAASVDLHAEMTRLTLLIVGRTILGARLDDHADEVRTALQTALTEFVRLRPGARAGAEVVTSGRIVEARGRLLALVTRLVAERRASGADGRDALSTLVAARDPESGGADRLTDAEIADEVITLMVAGHETTANAIAFCLWQLSSRPDLAERIRAEVDEAGDASWLDPRGRLPFTRRVVQETIRLFPPAWVFGRSLDAPIAFGGFEASPGDVVGVSPWVIHRSARWYDEPTVFDPDRWECRPGGLRYDFVPFGAGPRGCIGEQFAWIEATLIVAMLTRALDITVTRPVRLEFTVTLRPRRGIAASARRRS
ncbi:Epi-isozizaene 5-monooxygenase/(E)-beta-farnesene synthase [Microbacterium ginsengisoli]|nr:cytochrome P450 [Microbacterium ginsengisoli]KJL36054.1 Epi-isozizaene 5-monooxygenase/(E)-beta-farnesene synthase [Microbacterium ginsengisoli]MBN9207033.1 cytochrome P450 [Microbacterium ginsengisoli]